MSLSEAQLEQKRRHFFGRVILFIVVVIIAFLSLVFFFLFSNATVVEVGPDEAAVVASRKLTGFGFVVDDKVYLISATATLEVSAAGFIPQTIELQRTMARNVKVTLEEAQALVKAAASPAHDDIQWEIDGDLVGSGAALVTHLAPGQYRLTASHPYYETQEVALDLKRGSEREIAFTLKPAQGKISILSQPQGMPVMLDDELVGNTPLVFSREGGVYSVKIEAGDFDPIHERIEVTADNPAVSRDYHLQYKKARVNFKLTPANGRLTINGKLVTDSFPLTVEPLQETNMTYAAVGYFSQTKRQTFNPSQSTGVSFSLSPEYGKVAINAIPDAQIILNGEEVGITPKIFNLRAVSQEIMLVRNGYRSVTGKFIPTSKHTTKIAHTLKTELQARLDESPRKMTNSAGIELILFDPRKANMPFTIGAHRSEKGQRANEILRQVRLTKPFYVSRKEISSAQFQRFQSSVPASNLPVTNVTWNEAAGFCNWLSKNENLTLFYSIRGGRMTGFNPTSDGYRLLSEAEWEWLARYVNRVRGTKFVWGDTTVIPKGAGNLSDRNAPQSAEYRIPNYNDGYAQLAPVGSLIADAAGLYDMAGNISEWTHDFYTLDQPRKVLVNPLGPQRGKTHVVKGSSWQSGSLSALRSSFRQELSGKRRDVGVRIARYIYGKESSQ